MMEKTVDEDEIEARDLGEGRAADVRNEKIPCMHTAGMLEVAQIVINAQVARVSEMSGVGAGPATHVQDPARLAQVIVGKMGANFFSAKGACQRL